MVLPTYQKIDETFKRGWYYWTIKSWVTSQVRVLSFTTKKIFHLIFLKPVYFRNPTFEGIASMWRNGLLEVKPENNWLTLFYTGKAIKHPFHREPKETYFDPNERISVMKVNLKGKQELINSLYGVTLEIDRIFGLHGEIP